MDTSLNPASVPPISIPPQPQITDPRQALYAALAAAFITSAVPVVERALPGPGRGGEKQSEVVQAAQTFILNAAPLAALVPHQNPLTAFLFNVLAQQAYQHAVATYQVPPPEVGSVGAAVQAVHDVLATTGKIQPTSTLEAAPAAPAVPADS